VVTIDELAAKYVEMLRLRELHARDDEPDPRRDMAVLASRFPGALREIDDLTLETIRARIDELAIAARDPSRVAPWMTAQLRFHALARGALAAKRWLAGRKRIDAHVLADFDRALASLAWPDDARAWRDSLARIAAPPRGRLMDLVVERVAHELAIAARDARRLVFGESRRA
jgi:hypothetical protein